MSNVKEYQSEVIRSMFQAMTRADLLDKQRRVSKTLCEHLIKVIVRPNHEACDHWMDEIADKFYRNLTSVTLKNGSKRKPYEDLFMNIKLPNTEWESRRIEDIIKGIDKKYGGETTLSESEIERYLYKIQDMIPIEDVSTYDETREIIVNWHNIILNND